MGGQMHRLINRAFQSYIRDTFGPPAWTAIAQQAMLGFESFEPLRDYDPHLTERVVRVASELMQRPREALYEDMGTYLVSHPNTASVRRLLRFGGARFVDFLHSLDEMPERARLALPDLNMPLLEMTEVTPENFTLNFNPPVPGSGHILVGLLRAMADDYGALVVLEHRGNGRFGEVIDIRLADVGFASGRPFDLAAAGDVA